MRVVTVKSPPTAHQSPVCGGRIERIFWYSNTKALWQKARWSSLKGWVISSWGTRSKMKYHFKTSGCAPPYVVFSLDLGHNQKQHGECPWPCHNIRGSQKMTSRVHLNRMRARWETMETPDKNSAGWSTINLLPQPPPFSVFFFSSLFHSSLHWLRCEAKWWCTVYHMSLYYM